jgi:hypothetical protein
MDAMAPLIHEFTYQAMANDLLPIEDGSKYTLRAVDWFLPLPLVITLAIVQVQVPVLRRRVRR